MLSLLALSPLISLAAHAGGFEPVLKVDVAASYWDEGAKVAAYPGLQARLWGDDDSVLFGDTYLRIEGVAAATPSYARLGPRVVFSPIAIFELSAWALGSSYFGTFSSIKGFDDPAVIYTDDVLDTKARGGGWGTQWGTEATLRAKVGPIIFATYGDLKGWQTWASDVVVGDYYWEPESELLLSMDDLTWSINGVLLYAHDFDQSIGRKLYAGAMFNRATSVDTSDTFMRLGPMANFALNDQWAFLLLVQAYLEDRVYTDPLPPYIGARVRWTMPTKDEG